ncbi:MAG: alpha/beta fold hydrolase [Nanoarchaeota archaeon]|nr:alpha/beta fold hydrolase [Nanoarchaeota archaeon]
MEKLKLRGKIAKFIAELSTPLPKPDWATKHKSSLSLDNCNLLDFSQNKSDKPVFIIPPQAGHHSCIADYDANQSLVEASLKAGKKTYAAEWKSATFKQRGSTIDDCIISMKKCIEKIGSKVSLIGLCQGGWQSAIYASLYPEDVSSLVLAAAPIDFHAGNGMITKCALSAPMAFYESMVMAGNGVLDGKFMVMGFKMMNPEDRFFNDYRDLFEHIDDENFMKRARKFRAWYEYTQNLPGKFYLQVVKELFKENKLIKGKLEILGRKVNMKNISCPLYLIGGEKDDITLPEQVFAAEKYVSSKDITKLTVPAGHIGVFMGTKIVRDYWPGIFSSL